jgi:cell division septum initiation protein DivIVA
MVDVSSGVRELLDLVNALRKANSEKDERIKELEKELAEAIERGDQYLSEIIYFENGDSI